MNRKQFKVSTWMLSIYILMQFAPALLTLLLTNFLNFNDFNFVSINLTIASFIIGTIAIIWIDYKYKFTTAIEKSSDYSLKSIMFWGIIGFGLALSGQIIAQLIELYIFKIPIGSENTNYLLEIFNNYPHFILLISILAPISEEFIFRKVVYGNISSHFSSVIATLLSGLAFALIHFDGHILLYFTMASIFAFVYQKAGSIWAPILSHILMNTLAVLIAQ